MLRSIVDNVSNLGSLWVGGADMPEKMKDYYAVRDAVEEFVGSSAVPKKFPRSWERWVLAISMAVEAEQRQLNPKADKADIELTDETSLGSTSSDILDEIRTWLRGQSPFFKNV